MFEFLDKSRDIQIAFRNLDEESPATTQLLHIYQDVHPGDEPALDLDVPTCRNSPEHTSAQPDPDQCSSRETLRARQGVKRAAERGNLAFFEQRLKYEKAMRATECSLEERKIALAEQRLALERDQLDQRRREWEGQQRMLDEDRQLRCEELGRLQKQHEIEIQERRAEREASLATQKALLEIIHKLSQNKK
ncbi:uncharacterized protein LOC142559327 [Dermacentor variabilis]|uniref:uncharacterized protein LOC142559327 n=1 Tax=Dermacentor variabilis TaxID=34621 RepID=UPI003F5AF64B